MSGKGRCGHTGQWKKEIATTRPTVSSYSLPGANFFSCSLQCCRGGKGSVCGYCVRLLDEPRIFLGMMHAALRMNLVAYRHDDLGPIVRGEIQ